MIGTNNSTSRGRGGPLAGTRVLELGGIGPAPFAAMLLGDLGADVVRVVRPDDEAPRRLYDRGKTTVIADLKDPADVALVRQFAGQAHVLIEGFRPGVAERLGLGPEECLSDNPRLVYGRISGWGADGPLHDAPGHDINYLARSGVLSGIGARDGGPLPPLTLVGDFGGGGALLALGVCAALHHAAETGVGQVVAHSVLDGAALLSLVFHGLIADGAWTEARGVNLLDSGAPYYRTFRARDGRWLAVGALESAFYTAFVTGLGFVANELPDRSDRATWPQLHELFAARFAERTGAEWERVFAGTAACVTPVLTMREAVTDAHNSAHAVFVEIDGVPQPAPVPRFGRTPVDVPEAGAAPVPAARALAPWPRRDDAG